MNENMCFSSWQHQVLDEKMFRASTLKYILLLTCIAFSSFVAAQRGGGDTLFTTRYDITSNASPKKWDVRMPDSKLGSLANRLAKVGQLVPQEKVYVHMDNTSYFIGDSIWFSAYLRRTSDDQKSNISGILYVELLNHDGYVMERKMIEMRNGHGHGAFYLDTEYYPGYYELRAYTRWQLNWGVFEHKHSKESEKWFIDKKFEKRYFRDYEKLYSRVFPVYNAPKAPGRYDENMTLRILRRYFKNDPDAPELQVKLYPEGGNLIEGVPCRVAFEASYTDGRIADGTLTVGDEKEGAQIKASTKHRGRGTFIITPTKGYDRTVIFIAANGDKAKAQLPQAEAEGASLQILHNGSQWSIVVRKAGSVKIDTLGLTVMHEARVRHFCLLADSVCKIDMADSLLECGVNQVTVFDGDGRVYADRLFFVSRPELSKHSLKISGIKSQYSPYEHGSIGVEMTGASLSATSTDDKGKGLGTISLSIRDMDNASNLYDNANIQTEMLLSSEIQGFIPSPNWYFESDYEVHREALDLLMLTQGWRRFNWRQMAVKGEWDLTQPGERTPVIVGDVYNYYPGFFYHPKDWTDYSSSMDPHQLSDIADRQGWTDIHPAFFSSIEREQSKNHEIKKMVHIRAELITVDDTLAAVADIDSKDGKFRINLPKLYKDYFLFVAASDTLKWKKGKRYDWVQRMPDMDDKRKFRPKDGEFSLRIDHPYPRFVKPYTYYQKKTNVLNEKLDSSRVLPDGTRQLAEVSVRGNRRTHSIVDSLPAFSVDAYEAYNYALDAGMLSSFPTFIARAYVGDYGLSKPYIYTFPSNEKGSGCKSYQIFKKYGADQLQRMLKGASVNPDSANMRSTLKIDRRIINSTKEREDFYGNLANIERYAIYTDYFPRLEGAERYWGERMPETDILLVPYPEYKKRIFYRDRRYEMSGIAYPSEFYHIDYSRLPLPETPTDYRRTLYWNPALQLDSEGKATVEFYNNSRETRIEVSAEGVSASGMLLTGRSDM